MRGKIRKAFLKTVLLLICVAQYAYSQSPQVIKNGNKYYLSNKVVVKLKASQQNNLDKINSLSTSLSKKLAEVGIQKINRTYLCKNTNNSLDNIITIDYSSEIDPLIFAAKISKQKEVLWAEPKYVYQLDYVPNDPSLSLQYSLTNILARQAWDINKGDTSVVIGIVDTGVDWNHPDLAANIWINKKEIPNNGIDDDNNGYVDDYHGWDFGGLSGTADNNPMEDQSDHGTHVAGIASAVSDNGIGISSIGYKCRLMPVKVTENDSRDTNGPYVIYGFEGIIYAVDNGAKIINCSWGGNGYSRADQEVINYAVSKGVLVVVSAGNDNSSEPVYPSSYEGVLSVASVDASDVKSYFSNYGSTIDVCAPGESIYSTWMNDTYTYLSGTSMAAPLVAGLAGLVKSQFPNLSPIQIGEQIRVNSDNIDNKNSTYANKLGSGRVNAYKALSNTNSKSVRAYNITYSDNTSSGNNDGIFSPGEEIKMQVKLRNILNSTSNLSVNIQCSSEYVTIENSNVSIGAMGTFDSLSCSFKFIISDKVPYNEQLIFKINFTDGEYNDFQMSDVLANPAYLTQKGNNLALTITSTGNLGFNDYPGNTQGDGFRYKNGTNIMFEGSLMYGTTSNRINDAARVDASGKQSRDFSIVKPIIISSPGITADMEGKTIFNENTSSHWLGLETELRSFSFANAPYDKSIVLKYRFTNKSGADISNLYSGLFIDLDMVEGSGSTDEVNYDTDNNFGYVHHLGGEPYTYAGCALISSSPYGFYAVQNDGKDGGLGIYDGFSDDEKWLSISNGIIKKHAGPADVSFVVSTGPNSISSGNYIDIAFALAAGDNLEDLKNSILAIRNKYPSIITGIDTNPTEAPIEYRLEQNYPNPFNPTTNITFKIAKNGYVSLKVYDILGNEIATLVNEEKKAGSYNYTFSIDKYKLSSGVYFYRLTSDNFSEVKKAIVIK